MANHPYRALIPPVPEGTHRPLWSVMIPTYNCAEYLRQALASVLTQDLGPDAMQIEVVDDCSTRDDPEAVVRELAGERVSFHRQPQNVGHVGNFNTCLRRARGTLVHLLHGDDCVRDGFYARMQQPFLEHAELGAAFCRDIRMDEHGRWLSISHLLTNESGILPNWLETIAEGQRLQTPAMVVRRPVYEILGGFDSRFRYYGEDWEMWVRIAARFPVWYEVEPLAVYRIHTHSLSGQTLRTGENGRDLRRAIEINRDHLPPDKAGQWTKRARENFALACLRRAARLLSASGDRTAAGAQMLEALKSYPSGKVVLHLLPVLIRWSWRSLHAIAAQGRAK